MLEYRNVSIKTDKKNITSDISFTLDYGNTLAIVGESGGGKSMTALSLMGLLPDGMMMEGEILKDGALWSLKDRRNALGTLISLIPQNAAECLNPALKIKSQMYDGIRSGNKLNQAVESLKKSGFSNPVEILDMYPSQLSGGMAQRVAVAMSLLTTPYLLICDEPTNGMNPKDKEGFIEFLQENFTSSMRILITHDVDAALACDEILVLREGIMVFCGTKEEFLLSNDSYIKDLMEGAGIHD